MTSRWSDFYLDGDYLGFWGGRAANPDISVLMIVGIGFDPRCILALERMAGLDFGQRLGFVALKLAARPALGAAGRRTDQLFEANLGRLARLEACRCEVAVDIEMHDEEGHSVSGRKALTEMSRHSSLLRKYTDVVVDISGMPRGVFFPLLAYLLDQADKRRFRNLHVTVTDDPVLDGWISGREYGQATYLHTFRPQDNRKLVWLPVLGASESVQLEKVHNSLKGNCIEICPIVPFPARSLRAVDDIVVKHADLLFEGFQVSYDNLLRCDQRSPFDVYRKVLEVEEYYRERLGGIPSMEAIATVMSPLSSKTLSLGILLAAIERDLPVCHVEPGSYHINVDPADLGWEAPESGPVEIWLAGEPYEIPGLSEAAGD